MSGGRGAKRLSPDDRAWLKLMAAFLVAYLIIAGIVGAVVFLMYRVGG